MKIRRIALYVYALAVIVPAILFFMGDLLFISCSVCGFGKGLMSDILQGFMLLLFCVLAVVPVSMIWDMLVLSKRGELRWREWRGKSLLLGFCAVASVFDGNYFLLLLFLPYFAMPLAKRYLVEPSAALVEPQV